MSLLHNLLANPAHLVVAIALLGVVVLDLRIFTIPNRICVLILAMLPVAWLLHSPTPALLSSALAFALCALVLGVVWHLGHTVKALSFGGGDWKLLSVLSAWVGLEGMANLFVDTALIGGVETLMLVALRALVPAASALRRNSWTGPSLCSPGVPYGVSIALGGFLGIVELVSP